MRSRVEKRQREHGNEAISNNEWSTKGAEERGVHPRQQREANMGRLTGVVTSKRQHTHTPTWQRIRHRSR